MLGGAPPLDGDATGIRLAYGVDAEVSVAAITWMPILLS
jgi:hypothetical protein